MGKRQRRIRARSAPGRVAGAAKEKARARSPSSKTACPATFSQESPCARGQRSSTRPRPDFLSTDFHAPRRGIGLVPGPDLVSFVAGCDVDSFGVGRASVPPTPPQRRRCSSHGARAAATMICMAARVRPYEPEDLEPIVALSLRAWEPVFASLHHVLGDRIFGLLGSRRLP